MFCRGVLMNIFLGGSHVRGFFDGPFCKKKVVSNEILGSSFSL